MRQVLQMKKRKYKIRGNDVQNMVKREIWIHKSVHVTRVKLKSKIVSEQHS